MGRRGSGEDLERALRTAAGAASIASTLGGADGPRVLSWIERHADRADLHIAPLLSLAQGTAAGPAVISAARARVLRGPLLDALAALPFTGGTEWLTGLAGSVRQESVEHLLPGCRVNLRRPGEDPVEIEQAGRDAVGQHRDE